MSALKEWFSSKAGLKSKTPRHRRGVVVYEMKCTTILINVKVNMREKENYIVKPSMCDLILTPTCTRWRHNHSVKIT